VAQQVFALSVAEPTNLVLLGEDFSGELPTGRLLLDRLRDLLLRPQTSPATRDAVWRELIRRARADRSSWLVVALGMAMPGLRRQVRALMVSFPGDRDDVESAVAEGFVTELHRVDLTRTGLCGRLVRAGYRAGLKQAYQDAAIEGVHWSQFASSAPQAPWGHPDFVLADAVRVGVLSPQEAWLIGVTRLEDVPIEQVASLRGERTNTVVVRRHRAERRLREAIVEGAVSSGTEPLVSWSAQPSRTASSEPVLAAVSQPVGNRGLTSGSFPDAGSPGVAG
jgi:hypothetical protein